MSRARFTSAVRLDSMPAAESPKISQRNAFRTLLNLQAQLRFAGMSFDNVVKLQTILPDLANIGELRRIRAEIMGDCKPARPNRSEFRMPLNRGAWRSLFLTVNPGSGVPSPMW